MQTDYCIIGGGIVGLTIARELAVRFPERQILILEKESHLGEHASGRNSGVLHAGFYYAPDSLKARLTARGNQLLRRFCAENGVPVLSCGKVVVASAVTDLPRLDALMQRGLANGVELEMVDQAGWRTIEPLARTVDRAIWSPTTGVSDPQAVTAALQSDLLARKVAIRTNTQVRSRRGSTLVTVAGVVQAGHVVNTAGLYADTVAKWYGFCDDYVVMPFKGLYWYGPPSAPRLSRHVYPVPDPRNPFLGVHFTVTASGGVKVGPTAIPVLWREAYRGLTRFKLDEMGQVLTSFPKFLRSDEQDVAQLMRTEFPKYSRRHLVKQAQRLVPTARPADFSVRGRPGIRAQLMQKSTGRLEMDFVVRGDTVSTHVLNAVSPAWTGSLAFAEFVVDTMVANQAA